MRRVAVGALVIGVVVVVAMLQVESLLGLMAGRLICFEPLSKPLPPESIAELVEDAHLIVIGEVSDVRPGEKVYPPGLSPEVTNAGRWPEASLWLTPIHIEVLHRFKADGKIESVEYRRVGNSDESRRCDWWPYPRAGERFLYFLIEDRERETSFVATGPCRQIVLGSDGPSCSDRNRVKLSFMEGLSSDEFIEEVEREIAKRGSSATATPRDRVPENRLCPADSLTEDVVRERAMTWARVTGFENAEVTEVRLLTSQQFYDEHCIFPANDAECYWYVVMSGRMANTRWPGGIPVTPTPGPGNIFTQVEFVQNPVTGERKWVSYSTDPVLTPVPATEGPCPTRDYMAPPTPPALVPTPLKPLATP